MTRSLLLAAALAAVLLGFSGGPYLKESGAELRDAWLIEHVLRNDLREPIVAPLRRPGRAPKWQYELRVQARRLGWKYWHATHPAPVAPPAVMPAFPGAKGWGAASLDLPRDSAREGAWPLNIWFVTNTANSGTGSFRQAITDVANNSNAYNGVVFRTGGLFAIAEIDIAGVNNGYVAGQTAPGGGATFTGQRWRLRNGVDNLAVRYITWASKTSFNILVEDGDLVVFDHVSSRLSAKVGGANLSTIDSDSASTPSESASRFTFSYLLNAFPDSAHPTLMRFGGAPRSQPPVRRITAWRNFLAGPGHRMGNLAGDTLTQAQTVGYNWTDRAGEVREANQFAVNFLGNYFKTGPSTPASGYKGDYSVFVANDACNTTGGDGTCTYAVVVSAHRASQTGYDATVSDDSLWYGDTERVVACLDVPSGSNCATDGDTVNGSRIGTRLPTAEVAALEPDTSALTDALLATVSAEWGNSEGVDSLGAWFARRDAFDTARITEFNNSTGPSAWVDVDTFTVAAPAAGVACSDADEGAGDGMCDAWEDLHGLDKTLIADNSSDNDNDGWLAWEESVNGTDPNVFTDEDGNEAVGPNTYASPSNRRVYLASYLRDTTITPDSTDTAIVDVPFPESLAWASADSAFTLIPVNDSEALIVSLDTMSGSGTYALLDSATVDSICTANGFTTCPSLVRDREPGRGAALGQAEVFGIALYDDPARESRGWVLAWL